MPKGLIRYQQCGVFHFINFSCFHRFPNLGTAAARDLFERSLEAMRIRYEFVVCGYVVMPDHVHLLVSEPKKAILSKAIQALKLSVSVQSRERPFWQPRYYDFNVNNEEKRVEKLRYMHRNPVVRGLAEKAEDCHPTDEDLSVGTPVGVVQLPALCDRSGRKSRDRIFLDRLAARARRHPRSKEASVPGLRRRQKGQRCGVRLKTTHP
jgi:putative transposase